MKEYRPFVRYLNSIVQLDKKTDRSSLEYAIDGQAGKLLRQLVPIQDLRKRGAFFTSSSLAEKLVHAVSDSAISKGLILDPTCGAGNLLLAAARRLPRRARPEQTLSLWGSKLAGFDTAPEFVQAAKLRLWLLAVHLSPEVPRTIPELEAALPNIRVQNALEESELHSAASVVLLNPPYSMVGAPSGCLWGTGTVNSAAIFMENCLSKMKSESVMSALLPDVLRSGTRYGKWRSKITSLAKVQRLTDHDLFDEETDVNVFSALLVKSGHERKSTSYLMPDEFRTHEETVDSSFEVKVGTVVPYRAELLGPQVPYLTVDQLTPWSTLRNVHQERQFSGTTFRGPFIAIKRTSRPGDRFRAVATLVAIKQEVAVENHIIVCLPKDGKFRTCKQLMKNFQSHQSTRFLNNAIRCRHLTTTSIKLHPLSFET